MADRRAVNEHKGRSFLLPLCAFAVFPLEVRGFSRPLLEPGISGMVLFPKAVSSATIIP
jgi:hypothetical protein